MESPAPPTSPRLIGPLDLAAEREFLGGALEAAVRRVLESGVFVLGPEVEAFERAFAQRIGAPHAVAVSSGTDALVLALRALGVGPGDRVLTSPFTFFATVAAIVLTGAEPLFADVDPQTGLLTPRAAEAALDERTRCLMPVHLYGQPCDLSGFAELARRKGLLLLEDAAQAHGARRDGIACGELADAAAFSFYPTKNLGAAGEAGAILVRDGELARSLRELRDHGSPTKYEHARFGTNARMDAIQAAVLLAKLPHLDAWNRRRTEIAALYDTALASSAELRPLLCEPGVEHVYHQYALRVLDPSGGDAGERRDGLLRGLLEEGIRAAVHYPKPAHLQPAYAAHQAGRAGPRAEKGAFPAAESLAREVLCLPIHPFLSDADARRVAETLLRLA